MLVCDTRHAWEQFLDFVKERSSNTAFENWLSPIAVIEASDEEIALQVPNIFVQEYLLSNYKKDLIAFLPLKANGDPAIRFVIQAPQKAPLKKQETPNVISPARKKNDYQVQLNPHYQFETFIEGPANQFVKSAAMGVAMRPGQSYNPLFIHGGVGLGKTHILHSIGHTIEKNHKNLQVLCITTEGFINDLVDNLKRKSLDRMKKMYRNEVDVLLVDDIQFLQNRQNFEEEFCNTFETLINQNKQIVVTSDKPPAQLKLSERMIARMEWGLVAHMGTPDLETRVAILQHKAELRGLKIPHNIAFFIAEHIHNNVRQIEGAINRLSAHCRLLNMDVSEEVVENILNEMLHHTSTKQITVEDIVKSVATIFQVKLNEIKGSSRVKSIALPRQVAMYLAKEMINDSLISLGNFFGKSHSTILHACRNIEKKITADDMLRRQVDMVKRNVAL